MSFWYKSAENCQCHPNCSCQAERQGLWTSCFLCIGVLENTSIPSAVSLICTSMPQFFKLDYWKNDIGKKKRKVFSKQELDLPEPDSSKTLRPALPLIIEKAMVVKEINKLKFACRQEFVRN